MSVRLLLFVSVKSGGGLGQTLADYLFCDQSVKIFRLPGEAHEWTKLDKSILHNKDLKVVIAGGDGSVNWIVSLLAQYYGSDSSKFRPPVAVIPLGTGNDLSRTLSWGSSFTMLDFITLEERLFAIQNSKEIKNIDLWNIHITNPIGYSVDSKMINYFSLGVDANIANDFAETRRNYPTIFVSHFLSKSMYIPLTLLSLFNQPNLEEFLTGSMKMKNSKTKKLGFHDESKTFVVQAIPFIYGGADLVKDKNHRFVDDGYFEVITQGGVLSLGASHIGINLGRQIGQGNNLHLETNKEMCYQIDGEAFRAMPHTTLDIQKVGSYPFIYNPYSNNTFFFDFNI